jgi:hypothetical protein
MKKYLFLDIDFVLNSHIQWVGNKNKPEPKNKFEKDLSELDSINISILNSLFTVVPDVEIVLSSAWRFTHTPEEMTLLLRKKRYIGPDIISATPDNNEQRGMQCLQWLKANVQPEDLYSFVAVDDNSDFKDMMGRLVKTKQLFGLTTKDIPKIISVLNTPVSEEEKRKIFSVNISN